MLATYVDGGLGDLAELVHESGHAIHIAAIRTRPAFTDWPDSDALTEALAELVALDAAEPAWQRRWIAGRAAAVRGHLDPLPLRRGGARRRVGAVRDPAPRRPGPDARTTSGPGSPPTYLGIAPHPEWSWWAMRGQLVQEPGYMANYAIGAVLAADLRAAIRAARGDWTDGDPGWYAWVTDASTGSGWSAPPATSCATSSAARTSARCSRRSPGPGLTSR